MTDSTQKFTYDVFDREKETQKEIDLNFIDPKSDINYESIILLELFELNEFKMLEENLRTLYDRIDNHHLDRAIKIINSNNPSEYAFDRLPEIRNSKFDYKSFHCGITKDLGENFKYLNIRLTRISYLNIVLEIHASLTPEISNKMKNLMFEDYTEFVSEAKKSIIGILIFDMYGIKTEKINKFKQALKDELIQIISNFFKGYFMTSDITSMPKIDVFYLNYPENEVDVVEWGEKHGKFIGTCFQTYLSPKTTFKKKIFDKILLLLCKIHFDSNSPVILANKLKLSPRIDEDQDIELYIQNILISNSFSLIAIQKRIQSEVKDIGELNSTISKKIENVDDLNLNETLECIKALSKKNYYFKRIKLELDSVNHDFIHTFKSLEGEKDFFADIQKNIFNKIKNNENIIKILNENLRQFLDIKTIEYTNKTQKSNYVLSQRILIFTIVIVIVSIATIFKS